MAAPDVSLRFLVPRSLRRPQVSRAVMPHREWLGVGRLLEMITESDMLPLLIQACPSFLPTWQEVEIERGQDEPLVYIELGSVARHLVELFLQSQTTEFTPVFKVVERFHIEGDDYVQNAVTIGLLESIQNTAEHHKLNPEVFVPYLQPMSAAWWQALNRFWSSESPVVALPDTSAA